MGVTIRHVISATKIKTVLGSYLDGLLGGVEFLVQFVDQDVADDSDRGGNCDVAYCGKYELAVTRNEVGVDGLGQGVEFGLHCVLLK
jgi:hypothetical protein